MSRIEGYSFESIRIGLEKPRLIAQEFNRLYHRRLFTRSYNESGYDLFSEDWDNLLILDACRFDVFEEISTLEGSLSMKQSRGSATEEFLAANFHGQDAHDTVYVTASPMLYRHRDRFDIQFHAVENVWLDEGWDDRHKTVIPETVTSAALRAAEEYPNKRLLVHYLQPHCPFIGQTGRNWFQSDSLSFNWDVVRERDEITDNLLRQAYEENLQAALAEVEQFFNEVAGKTVVTADHGQLLGERLFPIPYRDYGHPSGVYVSELVDVPWLIHQNGPRREITRGGTKAESRDQDEGLTDVVDDRLRHLGYTE